MKITASNYIEFCKRWIGYKEEYNNKTIFNDINKLGNVEWCLSFIVACFRMNNSIECLPDITYSCSELLARGKKRGCVYCTAKVGDLAIFTKGHIGVVTKIQPLTVLCGNDKNTVREYYPVDNIAGFYRPEYDNVSRETLNTYCVQAGDNLTKISKYLNVSIDYLVETNNIKDKNKIYIGQILKY